MAEFVYKMVASPVGNLKVVASDMGLVAVLWPDDKPGRVRLGFMVQDEFHPVLVAAEKQLCEYFLGQRTKFALKLEPVGTAFQKEVWRALREIPFGQTTSYGELAKKIKRPKASRAVGAANSKNPISIITPCHRVIGAKGELTGFAGGLNAKEQLLNFEKSRI